MADGSILIVEDDERIGSSLLRAFVGSGYEARWVRTGAEALVDASAAALVLLDLGLPDMDGLDVCRALTKADPAQVVIVLCARSHHRESGNLGYRTLSALQNGGSRFRGNDPVKEGMYGGV